MLMSVPCKHMGCYSGSIAIRLWKTCSRALNSSPLQVASGEIGYGCHHGPRGEEWSSRVTRQDTSKAVSNRNWWTNEISVQKKVRLAGWLGGWACKMTVSLDEDTSAGSWLGEAQPWGVSPCALKQVAF